MALQEDLYAAVWASLDFNGVPVYSLTIGDPDLAAFLSIGNISQYMGYASIHNYPSHWLRPIFVIHAAFKGGRTDAPLKPIAITETGYYTLTVGVGWGGVPKRLQAGVLLRNIVGIR